MLKPKTRNLGVILANQICSPFQILSHLSIATALRNTQATSFSHLGYRLSPQRISLLSTFTPFQSFLTQQPEFITVYDSEYSSWWRLPIASHFTENKMWISLTYKVQCWACPLLPPCWHSSTITLFLPHICFPTLSHPYLNMPSFSSPSIPNSFLPQDLCKTCFFCLLPFSLTWLASYQFSSQLRWVYISSWKSPSLATHSLFFDDLHLFSLQPLLQC